jgi:hypothetical protein
MANYCHNAVSFRGELAQLIKLRLLFTEMERDSELNNTMSKPDFVKAEKGYMFDISVSDKAIHFRTRWVPNLEVIYEIGQHFGLNYVHQYEEPDTLVYGEAVCKDGVFTDTRLDLRDMQRITYDRVSETFSYQGKTGNEPYELWATLLEEKKANLLATPEIFRTTNRISLDELNELFGELLTGDLFLKLAEHKNFEAARELFGTWDEYTVVCMDNYLIAEMQHLDSLDRNRNEHIALLFLQELISKYQPEQGFKLDVDTGNRPGLKR